tara:strand:- start:3488 stop:5035 length:1548 start_codon:yes stop_codon:yes gene_type:complete
MDIKSFLKCFGYPELKSLLSNRFGIAVIVIISVISFWAIGFSKGSKAYLKEKMDSPFVKYVSVEIPNDKNDPSFIKHLNDTLNTLSKNKSMSIVDHEFVTYATPYFYKGKNITTTNSKSPTIRSLTRGIKEGDDFYNFVMHPSNKLVVYGDNMKTLPSWSVVVTRKFLKKLGADENSAYLYYYMGDANSNKPITIPIFAVVKHLPDNVDILTSTKLFMALDGRLRDKNPLKLSQPVYRENWHQQYFISTAEENGEKFAREKLRDSFDLTEFKVSNNIETHVCGINVRFRSIDDDLTVNDKLTKLFDLNTITRTYRFDEVHTLSENEQKSILKDQDKEKLNVRFLELDEISVFEGFITNEGLNVDMSTIEASSNFSLFSKITNILSLVLSAFSIVFIITYLSKSIISHINKNAKNLGTLKAFGLSNTNILWIYTGISGVLVLSVFIVAFLAAFYLGPILTRVVANFFDIDAPNNLYALVLNLELIVSFVLVPVIVIGFAVYGRIKSATPGDLIYER